MTDVPGREGRVYRELYDLLREEDRYPASGSTADDRTEAYLDTVEDVVANMEAALAGTMEELEALRGEMVFEPDRYSQSFTYAGHAIRVTDQGRRSIVDMYELDPLRDRSYSGGELDSAEAVYTAPDSPARWAGNRRRSVDRILEEEIGTTSSEATEAEMMDALEDVLEETAYTHTVLSGDAEERIDDILAMARDPEGRSTVAPRGTVRSGVQGVLSLLG